MSLYEALVLVAMVGVGGFAWHLYRKDIRTPEAGAPPAPASSEGMFARNTKNEGGDSPKT
jgi:hypothetical protein